MDAAGSERAAVVGISEAGPMAVLLAATHPDRMTHLVLVGTYARMARADDYPIGFPPEGMLSSATGRFVAWARAPAAPERVLSTVLFTDIVGSTERAAKLGDRAWRELLDRHDELVRRQVSSQAERLIKSTGDELGDRVRRSRQHRAEGRAGRVEALRRHCGSTSTAKLTPR